MALCAPEFPLLQPKESGGVGEGIITPTLIVLNSADKELDPFLPVFLSTAVKVLGGPGGQCQKITTHLQIAGRKELTKEGLDSMFTALRAPAVGGRVSCYSQLNEPLRCFLRLARSSHPHGFGWNQIGYGGNIQSSKQLARGRI